MYFYEQQKLCISFYANTEELLWELEMAMKLQDCYKVFISCIYDFTNWTGEDAKYIDQCSQSSKEDYILYKKQALETSYYYYGGPDKFTSIANNASCKPGTNSFLPIKFISGSPLQTTILGNLLGWVSRGNNSQEWSILQTDDRQKN